MNKRKAEAVLTAVKRKYRAILEEYSDEQFAQSGPKLVRDFYRDGDYVVSWEEGPDDWAIRWSDTEADPTGVFTEPVYSFALGIHDA